MVPGRYQAMLATVLFALSAGTSGMEPWDLAAQDRAGTSDALVISNLGPGQFVLQTNESLDIDIHASIESLSPDGQWVPISGSSPQSAYQLRASCSEDIAGDCRRLGARESFQPLPWDGYDCDDLCGTDCADKRFRAGPHRLRVHQCDNRAVSYTGNLFEVPATPEMLPRWRAAAGVASASIARLHALDIEENSGADTGRIAGFRVVEGSERSLDAHSLSALLAWLRADNGFIDHVARRCLRGNAFGFFLSQEFSKDLEMTTEIAVDFQCNSMSIVRNTAHGRIENHAFFDPSRSELKAIVERALGEDSIR